MNVGERSHASANIAVPAFERSIKGWKVLGALWLLVLLVVAVPSVGSSVINAAMVAELGMNRTMLGLGFGIFVMMMGLQGPLVVAMLRRYGYSTTITIGGLAVCGGSVVMATVVSEGWEFALAFGLVIGSGTCIAGMLPTQTMVTKWFTARRAFAVSVVLSAMEVGGLIAPPALEKGLQIFNNNWRIGWWLMAALSLIAVATVRFVIDETRIDQIVGTQRAAMGGSPNGVGEAEAWPIKRIFRSRGYWAILSYMSIVGIGWVFLMSQGVVNLQGLGYSLADAALSVAIVVVASFVGNMGAGMLGDRISPRFIASASSILMAFGFVMLVAPQGFTGIVLYAVPAGMGYGASQVCIMAIIANYFGKESFAAVFGSMMPIGTFCAAAGAVLAGVIYDHQGSYTLMCVIAAVISVVASLSILFAYAPARRIGARDADAMQGASEFKTVL